MSTMSAWTMTSDDLVKVANDVKELTLKTLVEQKVLTEKQADDFSFCFAIVAVQPNMFRKIFNKITQTANAKVVTFEYVQSTNNRVIEKTKKEK